jgi:uncharacterized repeat protein (TIGR01451 family)
MKTRMLIAPLRLILTGLLMLFLFAQAAQANLVTNPFFTGTATNATGWTSSAAGTGATFNRVLSTPIPPEITAAGGTTEFYSGCVGAPCLTFPFVVGTSSGAQQTVNTAVGTAHTLSFWVFGSGPGLVEVDVYWGNTRVYAGVNPPAGWSFQTINLGVATTASSVLTVLIRDDPAYSAITFMDVEPVVLSLSKANPATFAVGVPANYSLTITNGSTIASGATFTLLDQLPPNIQYNSVAFGAGLTGAACVASGTVAAGQLLTCTITRAGGIPAGGTGSLTINVTPLAASAGVAGINKASVQPNGGVASVGSSTAPPAPPAPSTCTATGTPLGCAVAPSLTPTAALLSFIKDSAVICDPVNGTSSPKRIPGAVVRYTITVTNAGATSVNLTTIADIIHANTTPDPNLITGAGGAAGCRSATGTPESGVGRGFKLSLTSSRPAAAYPKFFTTAADADAASFSAGTVTMNYALGMPAEGVAPVYTAGELKPGEIAVFYFNVTVN